MATGILNRRQRETLRSWSFLEHFGLNQGYYGEIVRHVESTVSAVHTALDDPSDYLDILQEILQYDPILDAYVRSQQYIEEDTRGLFIIMFAKLIVAEVVEQVVAEVEERQGL